MLTAVCGLSSFGIRLTNQETLLSILWVSSFIIFSHRIYLARFYQLLFLVVTVATSNNDDEQKLNLY